MVTILMLGWQSFGQSGAAFSCIFFKSLHKDLFSCAAVTAQNLKCLPTSQFWKYLNDFLMKRWDLYFYCWVSHSWLFSSPLSLPPADVRKLDTSSTQFFKFPALLQTSPLQTLLNELCPTQASSKNGFFSLTQVMTAGAPALWPSYSPAPTPLFLSVCINHGKDGRINRLLKPETQTFPVLPCCHLCLFSPSV